MKPQAQETDSFHPMGGYLPGVGLVPKLSSAVFAITKAGAAPAAPVEDGDAFYVFKVTARERADLSKFTDSEKKSVRDRVETQRKNELYSGFIERLRKGAKIVQNESALSYESAPSHETYNPDDY